MKYFKEININLEWKLKCIPRYIWLGILKCIDALIYLCTLGYIVTSFSTYYMLDLLRDNKYNN